MKLFWLLPKDQRENNFVLYRDATASSPVTLRERYLPLRCAKCGKLDETRALGAGLDADVRIQAKTDFVGCDYGLIAISTRLQSIMEKTGIRGVRWATLPGDERYFMVLPERIAPTDTSSCGMTFLRPCPSCGRYRETCGLPSIASIDLGAEPLAIMAPSTFVEGSRGRRFVFAANAAVVNVFRANKASGFEYIPAN